MTDEMVANAPIVILGNKIDMSTARSEDDIRNFFGLIQQTTGKVSSRLGSTVILEKTKTCIDSPQYKLNVK